MIRPVLHGLSVCGGVLLLTLAARATIVVDAGGGGDVTTLRIRNVPAGHQFVLRGLTIDQSADPTVVSTGSLRVEGPGGTVWVEDCTIDAGKGAVLTGLGTLFFPAGPAVLATDGATVLLERCTLQGGDGYGAGSFLADKWNGQPGQAAVLADDSRVVIHGGTLRGGDGGDGETPFAPTLLDANGGDALFVTGTGFAHVAGSQLTGGDNGLNATIDTDAAGNALVVTNLSASAWLRDSILLPGQVQGSGLPGADVVAPPGTVTGLPASARAFAVSSPLREGQAGAFAIDGSPGDEVLLLVSLDADALPMVGRQGVLQLDPGLLLHIVPLGTITAPDGHLDVPFVAPAMNPADTALTVPMQPAGVASGVATLEAGSALAWLDAGL